MKRTILYILLAVAAVSAPACILSSCSKDGGKTDNGQDPDRTEQEAPLGTYEFDGVSCDIHTAVCEKTASYYTFVFSPQFPDEPQTTYFILALRNYWVDGERHNIHDGTGMSHNDDYMVVYESPECYYSQTWRLQDGTFCVKALANGMFIVQADLLLNDGTPLSIDYFGEIQVSEE